MMEDLCISFQVISFQVSNDTSAPCFGAADSRFLLSLTNFFGSAFMFK
jgi:hypothetical protein